MVILEFDFKSQNAKIGNSVVSPIQKKKKRNKKRENQRGLPVAEKFRF